MLACRSSDGQHPWQLASGANSAATVSVSGASFVPSQKAADEVRDCHKMRPFAYSLADPVGAAFSKRRSNGLCWGGQKWSFFLFVFFANPRSPSLRQRNMLLAARAHLLSTTAVDREHSGSFFFFVCFFPHSRVWERTSSCRFLLEKKHSPVLPLMLRCFSGRVKQRNPLPSTTLPSNCCD